MHVGGWETVLSPVLLRKPLGQDAQGLFLIGSGIALLAHPRLDTFFRTTHVALSMSVCGRRFSILQHVCRGIAEPVTIADVG